MGRGVKTECEYYKYAYEMCYKLLMKHFNSQSGFSHVLLGSDVEKLDDRLKMAKENIER